MTETHSNHTPDKCIGCAYLRESADCSRDGDCEVFVSRQSPILNPAGQCRAYRTEEASE